MAIFNKPDQQADYTSNITTIAAGTKLTGTISIQCALHIDGEFEGEINSNNVVTIGSGGNVKSGVKANKLIVTGRYTGTAECDSIELISGGEADGKLISSSLTIDAESSFQGESIKKSSQQPQKVLEMNEKKAPTAESKSGGQKGLK